MPPRRPQPTAASKARADRIAAALAGLLEDVPPPQYSGPDPYRGAELPPKPTPSPESLRCPACRGTMELADERGIEIHRCSACFGLWLDPGELDDLVATPPADPRPDLAALREEMRKVAPPTGEVRYRMCPRCSEPMNRRNYGSVSGVVIDQCTRHGLYLDAREFDAIETFIGMGGLELQRQHFDERLRERERTADDMLYEAQMTVRQARSYYRRRWLWDIFGF